MNALLFPGQGSQVVGMGLEFYNNFDIVKKIFQEANDRLKYDVTKMIFEGPEEVLKLTKNTQPAILTVSYSIFKVLEKNYGYTLKSFEYFAGHSLGEYSALVSSESLSFSDALYLLHERGKSMQEAVPVGEGGMIAVLGLKIHEINNLLKTHNQENEICEIANDNAEGQVIISGIKKSIDNLMISFKEKKIKSIPLKVSAPFHCYLMRPAAESMKEKITSTEFKDPKVKIINNVTAKAVDESKRIKELLIKQIYSTVKWRESILNIADDGVKNFIELGPGKALIGMVKRTIKNANCFSINSIVDIKKLEYELRK
tara:strand:+ start:2627 stop:3568 length:942 start_codon:yes stop_codon:yes gene_type:complete